MIPAESVDLDASATQAHLGAAAEREHPHASVVAPCDLGHSWRDCGCHDERLTRDDSDRAVLDREAP